MENLCKRLYRFLLQTTLDMEIKRVQNTCSLADIDFEFVIDSSGSVGQSNWQITMDYIGPIQTLFLRFLKSSNFGIWTLPSDSTWKMSLEIEKMKSCEVTWPFIFLILRFETLTHNNVNTISANRKWTLKSWWEYWSILRGEFWWCRDYVIWRNYEKSIFWTWAILESLIRQVSTYAHISNWNFNANSVHIKFFEFAYANFLKRDFLLNA